MSAATTTPTRCMTTKTLPCRSITHESAIKRQAYDKGSEMYPSVKMVHDGRKAQAPAE